MDMRWDIGHGREWVTSMTPDEGVFFMLGRAAQLLGKGRKSAGSVLEESRKSQKSLYVENPCISCICGNSVYSDKYSLKTS
jgi:hypothetical protein